MVQQPNKANNKTDDIADTDTACGRLGKEEEHNSKSNEKQSDDKKIKLDEKKSDDDRSNKISDHHPKLEASSNESTDVRNKNDVVDVVVVVHQHQPNKVNNKTDDIVDTRTRSKADPANVEMENSDDDDNTDDDSFEAFRNIRSAVKKRKKKQTPKIKIKIAVPKSVNTKTNNKVSTIKTPPILLLPGSSDSFMPINQEETEKELEDSLKFFQQPHEDQDPSYRIIQKKERNDFIVEAVKKINDEDATEKIQIEAIVKQQLKEKQDNTERTIEKYRIKIEEEYKRDMIKVQKAYQDKSRSNQAKIDQGIKLLKNRHHAENQKLHQQHRHQSQQRQLPEQAITAEWQQISHRLRQKHHRQMAEFSTKGNDVVTKCKNEFERQRHAIETQYEKRKQDLNTNRTNLYSRIYVGFQQLRQRYLKRHTQSIAKRIKALEHDFTDDPDKETIEKRIKKKTISS